MKAQCHFSSRRRTWWWLPIFLKRLCKCYCSSWQTRFFRKSGKLRTQVCFMEKLWNPCKNFCLASRKTPHSQLGVKILYGLEILEVNGQVSCRFSVRLCCFLRLHTGKKRGPAVNRNRPQPPEPQVGWKGSRRLAGEGMAGSQSWQAF